MSDNEKPTPETVVPIVTEPIFIENTEPLPLPIFGSFASENPKENPYDDT